MMKMSHRIRNHFELARNIALQSNHKCFRHGAALVQGNRVLNTACNDLRYTKFASRFLTNYQVKKGCASRHAELKSVLGISRQLTQGADVFVVRVNWQGKFKLSKPCPMCMACMSYVGVKRVFYSIDEDNYGVIKL